MTEDTVRVRMSDLFPEIQEETPWGWYLVLGCDLIFWTAIVGCFLYTR